MSATPESPNVSEGPRSRFLRRVAVTLEPWRYSEAAEGPTYEELRVRIEVDGEPPHHAYEVMPQSDVESRLDLVLARAAQHVKRWLPKEDPR